MSKLVLGLDLGPNSVGWALVREGDESAEPLLVDLGVRVFPEGVDAFDTSKEVSRNEARRVARGMRRQVRRRARRKRLVREALRQVGLWPTDPQESSRLAGLDPYLLRDRALSEQLDPHEIGRVLLHLNQRRGFLSNKKKDRGDKEVQGMLAEIANNEKLVQAGGFETVGQMLAARARQFNHAQRKDDDHIRRRHLARRQLWDEFDKIWARQAQFHPQLLTDRLRDGQLGAGIEPRKPIPRWDARRRNLSDLEAFGLRGLIFFQRPIYWPRSVVGQCELEPKEKRCPKSDRSYQRFRVLQEVNNLRYISPDDQQEYALDEPQHKLLLDFLATRDKATFDQIRKKLGFLESVKFNLERGSRSALKGFTIDHLLASAVGKHWHDRPEVEKDRIVRLLLDHEGDEQATTAILQTECHCTAEEAETLLALDLPPGYGSLSLKAIEKLLPHLERGLVYQSVSDPAQSALHAAGYLRRDELQRYLFERLPALGRVSPKHCKLADIPNPVVKRALVELRKVVNAIVAEYGRPDEVHIELAREVQMGRERRAEAAKRMREREALREAAAEAIRAQNQAPRRESITRHLLWEEQGGDCPYCGKTISQAHLFGGETDVDHILPRSRTLDDSQMNKVVVHATCNRDKGNRTPYEWLADADPQRYAQVCQRAALLMQRGRMAYPKYRRFLQKELKLDQFIARQLTDTAYISRAAQEYLRLLVEHDHDVIGLKGQLTAELRWHWGLATLLKELPDSPAWSENADLTSGEKDRADHRHHAIDALVIALTNRSRLIQLSDIVQRGGARRHGEVLEEPWPGFRESVRERVQRLIVSHRADRKVRGALHEETQYGPTEKPGEWVMRKAVVDLSPAEVERIRDAAIRRIVVERLRENGIEFGRGKKPDARKMKAALSQPPLTMKSGVPIKKVRLVKQELTIQPLRDEASLAAGGQQAYVKPGSMHHLCIFEYLERGRPKREAVFVSMLQAMGRLKRREPVIQRVHPDRPEARFIMSLSSREMVLADWEGQKRLLVFKTAASTSGQMWFAEHTDARRSAEQRSFTKMASSLIAQKVTVSPLGRLRWAND